MDDIEKQQKGILKRKDQLRDLRYWLETRDEYSLQVNFCVPRTADHIGVTVTGPLKKDIGKLVMKALEGQIKHLERKYGK